VVAICLLGYNASSKAVNDVYLQQMSTVSNQIATQLEIFYEGEVKQAGFLVGNQTIIDMVKNGNYEGVGDYLKSINEDLGVFKNAFLSTADADALIVADGMGGKWVGNKFGGGIGFDENIEYALKGEVWASKPYMGQNASYPLTMLTTPMISDEKVIAILFLPADLGEASASLITGAKIGETGDVSICDLDGKVFASPNLELVMKVDLSEFDWGKELLSLPRGSFYRFDADGKKIAYITRNEKYGFVASSIMDESEIAAVG
jgi:methyl-accepting chemotaxis protein